MTIEEINARIKAVERMKAFYESERDRELDKAVRKSVLGVCDIAERYLDYAREVELLERELKRLGSERVHIIIGNPPYDGDES